MKIRIDDITEDGLELNFSGDEDILSAAIKNVSVPEGTRISPSVKGHLLLSSRGEDIAFDGTFQARVEARCSRCLAVFPEDKLLTLELVLRPRKGGGMEEEISLADADAILVEGPEIDVGEIIVQELLLELPMKPLCREDCPGLCPTCGALKGSPSCTCQKQSGTDPRWAALEKLKPKIPS